MQRSRRLRKSPEREITCWGNIWKHCSPMLTWNCWSSDNLKIFKMRTERAEDTIPHLIIPNLHIQYLEFCLFTSPFKWKCSLSLIVITTLESSVTMHIISHKTLYAAQNLIPLALAQSLYSLVPNICTGSARRQVDHWGLSRTDLFTVSIFLGVRTIREKPGGLLFMTDPVQIFTKVISPILINVNI